MSDFKPTLICKFYENRVIDEILGIVCGRNNKQETYLYKVWVLASRKYISGETKYKIFLKVVNDNDKIELSEDSGYFDDNVSGTVLKELYKLLEPLILNYSGDKEFSINLKSGFILIDRLR